MGGGKISSIMKKFAFGTNLFKKKKKKKVCCCKVSQKAKYFCHRQGSVGLDRPKDRNLTLLWSAHGQGGDNGRGRGGEYMYERDIWSVAQFTNTMTFKRCRPRGRSALVVIPDQHVDGERRALEILLLQRDSTGGCRRS